MEKFKNIISNAIVVETENVDTDQIIPAKYLKTTEKTGLGKYMFYNWRFDESGNKRKSVFNSKSEEILIAGKNFGIGSSREHAVWALMDFGFKVIISSEFGDIFYNNSLKNGLLCIKLKEAEVRKIINMINKNAKTEIRVNLEDQTVTVSGIRIKFLIDSFRKSCLLMGVDELGYILSHEDKIREYEKNL